MSRMTRKERERQEHVWQEWKAKGAHAFREGKPMSAIDEAGLFNLGRRNAWLIGWRNAGGKLPSESAAAGQPKEERRD